MNDATPMQFTWDAEKSVMVPRRKTLADQTYVDQEEYRLGVIEERSINSHNHFFSALAETWANLPDALAERFPTVEKLRKDALIHTGWCDSHTFVCASKAEAQRLAAFIRPIDEFSIIVVKEATVTRYIAKSQSMKAMGKDDFTKSKQDVLDYVSALIGSTRQEVQANAGRAA